MAKGESCSGERLFAGSISAIRHGDALLRSGRRSKGCSAWEKEASLERRIHYPAVNEDPLPQAEIRDHSREARLARQPASGAAIAAEPFVCVGYRFGFDAWVWSSDWLGGGPRERTLGCEPARAAWVVFV